MNTHKKNTLNALKIDPFLKEIKPIQVGSKFDICSIINYVSIVTYPIYNNGSLFVAVDEHYHRYLHRYLQYNSSSSSSSSSIAEKIFCNVEELLNNYTLLFDKPIYSSFVIYNLTPSGRISKKCIDEETIKFITGKIRFVNKKSEERKNRIKSIIE